ncbi:hypothetical protein MPY17_21540 [Rhodococcus opacus]|uniref:hypothetical protein n=1 Tax=Rhodococcus opacus TaxID=37919 RepID=UPI001FF6D25F|nr:hypothetical protein [Rhodococcus opacus]UOT01579.1 hypothetical protein MPY17_21540 [Rhodococcus opacus]
MINDRLEILTVVMAGLDRRTELMAVVEVAPDPDAARRAAVLAMQLRRFSVREREKIRREPNEVEAERRRIES